MISYAVFKDYLKEGLRSFLPKPYCDYDVFIQRQQKDNCTLDGITLLPKETGTPVPVFRIPDLYEHYKQVGDVDAVVQDVAENFITFFKEIPSFWSRTFILRKIWRR